MSASLARAAATPRPDARWINGRVATSVVILAYALVCIPLSRSLNLWIDEGYTLHATGASLGYAVHAALAFEEQPPLYYVLLALWRHLDGSDFFARLFSTLCVAAALAVVAEFARRRFAALPTTAVVALLALNPFSVWAGTEARLYGLAMLLATLVVVRFLDTFLREDDRTASIVPFVLAAIAALYTQYYLGALLVAGAISLAVLRRPREARRYAVALAVTAVAFAPMASVVYAQLHASSDGTSFALGPAEAAKTIAAILLNFALPHAWIHQSGHASALNAIFFGAVAIALGTAFARTRIAANATTLALGIFVATTAVFFLAVNVIAREQLAPRYLVGAFVPEILAAIALGDRLASAARPAVLATAVAVVLLLDAVGLYRLYPEGAKPGDWIRVAAYVSARARPSEPIAFFHQEEAFMFAHYFHGPSDLVPIPAPLDFERYRTAAFALHADADVARALGRAADARSLWLVRVDPCRFEYWQLGCEHLTSYVRRNYRVVGSETFFGTAVFHLERILRRPA